MQTFSRLIFGTLGVSLLLLSGSIFMAWIIDIFAMFFIGHPVLVQWSVNYGGFSILVVLLAGGLGIAFASIAQEAF